MPDPDNHRDTLSQERKEAEAGKVKSTSEKVGAFFKSAVKTVSTPLRAPLGMLADRDAKHAMYERDMKPRDVRAPGMFSVNNPDGTMDTRRFARDQFTLQQPGKDDQTINGFHLPARAGQPTVVFFGGTDFDRESATYEKAISDMANEAKKKGMGFAVYDYPEGMDEEKLRDHTQNVINHLKDTHGVSLNQQAYAGYSLGGYPALVAANLNPQASGVHVTSTFSSARQFAKDIMADHPMNNLIDKSQISQKLDNIAEVDKLAAAQSQRLGAAMPVAMVYSTEEPFGLKEGDVAQNIHMSALVDRLNQQYPDAGNTVQVTESSTAMFHLSDSQTLDAHGAILHAQERTTSFDQFLDQSNDYCVRQAGLATEIHTALMQDVPAAAEVSPEQIDALLKNRVNFDDQQDMMEMSREEIMATLDGNADTTLGHLADDPAALDLKMQVLSQREASLAMDMALADAAKSYNMHTGQMDPAKVADFAAKREVCQQIAAKVEASRDVYLAQRAAVYQPLLEAEMQKQFGGKYSPQEIKAAAQAINDSVIGADDPMSTISFPSDPEQAAKAVATFGELAQQNRDYVHTNSDGQEMGAVANMTYSVREPERNSNGDLNCGIPGDNENKTNKAINAACQKQGIPEMSPVVKVAAPQPAVAQQAVAQQAVAQQAVAQQAVAQQAVAQQAVAQQAVAQQAVAQQAVAQQAPPAPSTKVRQSLGAHRSASSPDLLQAQKMPEGQEAKKAEGPDDQKPAVKEETNPDKMSFKEKVQKFGGGKVGASLPVENPAKPGGWQAGTFRTK